MPTPRRPTMADVARLAGVSGATVSFVLNRSSGHTISEQTRARVLAAVAELDYRPNHLARSLRTRRSGTIAFVTDEIAVDPNAGATILGAHEAAWARGCMVIIVNTTPSMDIVADVVEELLDRSVDGIVFATVGTKGVWLPKAMSSVPSVLVNGYMTGDPVPTILPDDVKGGHTACSLLLNAGHTEIAFLSGQSDAWATQARTRGIRRALQEHGIDPTSTIVQAGNFHADSGYELTRALLRGDALPTGILYGNDRMAIGGYLALAEAGIRVPEDVSVVGYDDQTDIASDLRPALTTVQLPYYRMGRLAVERLLARTTASMPPRTYLSCPAVPRASVARPHAGRRRITSTAARA